jgi:hypothetical protein
MRPDHLESRSPFLPVKRCLPLGAAAVAAALALASFAAADEASECTPAEPPQKGECDHIDTFSTDPLAALNPNDTLHLIPYFATVNNIAVQPLSGPIRFAAGAGLLFGIAPLSTQALRLSIGGTFLAGQWGGDGLGDDSVEPRVRAAVNLTTLAVLPLDVYVEGVAPYFFASKEVTPGFGAGVSVRALWIPVDLGADYLFGNDDFGRAERPASGAVRIFASVGFDLLAATGATQRAAPQQTRVDLRCDLLDQARRLMPPGETPAYCGDVTKALDGAHADHEMTAMARFLTLLPASLSTKLTKLDALYTSCIHSERRTQRVCVDCMGRFLSNWFTYTVDPHQVAAALGCIPGVNPEDAMCPDVDAEPARRYTNKCP